MEIGLPLLKYRSGPVEKGSGLLTVWGNSSSKARLHKILNGFNMEDEESKNDRSINSGI